MNNDGVNTDGVNNDGVISYGPIDFSGPASVTKTVKVKSKRKQSAEHQPEAEEMFIRGLGKESLNELLKTIE